MMWLLLATLLLLSFWLDDKKRRAMEAVYQTKLTLQYREVDRLQTVIHKLEAENKRLYERLSEIPVRERIS